MKKILICVLLLSILCCICGCDTNTNPPAESPEVIVSPIPSQEADIIIDDNPTLDFRILGWLSETFENVTLIQNNSLINVTIRLTQEEEDKINNSDIAFEDYFANILSTDIIKQAKAENTEIIITMKYTDNNLSIIYNVLTQELDFETSEIKG